VREVSFYALDTPPPSPDEWEDVLLNDSMQDKQKMNENYEISL